VTRDERVALEAAQPGSQQVRHWRRDQAVLLRADGVPVAVVARTLGCTETSGDTWSRSRLSGPSPGWQHSRRSTVCSTGACSVQSFSGYPLSASFRK
jgi:hypothetical protein